MTQGAPLVVHYKQLWMLDDLLRLPRLSFEKDWYGENPRAKTQFVLASDKEILHYFFWCYQKPTYDPEEKTNLWHYDVTELFIAQNGVKGYLEVNLSPSGAVWSASFKGSREVGEGGPTVFNTTAAKARANVSGSHWSVHFELPLNEPLSEEIRMNVTAIVDHQTAPQYLSWLNMKIGEPDFHRPFEFLPIELKKY